MRRPHRQSSPRKLWWIAGGLLLLALPAAGLVYVVTADWRPLIERKAGEALGRAVTIGELHLGWGRRLALEARDIHIANMPGSDKPDMVRIRHLTARIDLSALIREEMRYEQLALDGVEIVLERKDDGARNWRFGGAPSEASATATGLALVPKNRRQFPTLLDMTLHDGAILYRSEGRKDIRIALADVALGAPDAASPVRMTVKGAYNDLPIDLAIDGGSFTEMRKGDVPYPADFTATSGGTKIAFKGTFAEPLDFEGARGRLDLAIADFAGFLKMFGYDRPLNFQVMLQAADFTRDGDRWALSQTQGKFKDSSVAGSFVFVEGARGQPDAATVDVSLDQFDLKTLMQGIAEPGGSGDASSFRPELAPSTTLDARIASKSLRYGDVAFDDVRLHGRMMPGEIVTNELSLGFGGGRITGDGSLRAQGADGAARINVAYANADVARLAKMAGLGDGLLSGALDARIALAMTGPTLEKALAASEGQAVIAMKGGEIARSLLEKVSVDLRSIFRRNSQSAAIQCLLIVADIQKGNARILPLTLRTADTRLVGGGALDMPSGQLDLLIRSDPKSTGSLALDLPLRVTGPLDGPSVTPRLGAGPDWLAQPPALPAALDAPGRALAAGTGCAS